jgi:hypothetical protein
MKIFITIIFMLEFTEMEGENLHVNRFIQAGHVAIHLRGT